MSSLAQERPAGARTRGAKEIDSGLSKRRADRHNEPIGRWPTGEAVRAGQP